jgi:quercetin dioxygenase-like cupin family protein
MRVLALAALLTLTTSAAAAQAPPPVARQILQKVELEGDKHATTLAEVKVVAGGVVPRHTHDGVEIGYILQGEGQLMVEGRPTVTVGPGASFQIPEGLVHSLQNGPAPMVLVVAYVTEKDKPLSKPAP